MIETKIKLNGAIPQENSIKEELKLKVSSLSMIEQGNLTFSDCSKLYFACFEKINSTILFENNIIHPEKLIEFIEKRYEGKILKKFFRQDYHYNTKKMIIANIIFILNDEMIIDITIHGTAMILFNEKGEDKAQCLANEFKKFTFKKKHDLHKINILLKKGIVMDLVELINKKPDLVIGKNYNDDLSALHKKIVIDINKYNEGGLFLFHGAPGTGKSTYIRYLIHCTKKKVIFMTPKLAGNLDSPQLLNLLLENSNSILVIEDAEDLLQSRDSGMNPYISMLLNLTDGLLGGNLGIKIICTFNGNFNKIDSALLRKGRLIAKYEFKELSIEKAQALSDSLGFKTTIDKPLTLAEIYNQAEENFNVNGERKRIGF